MERRWLLGLGPPVLATVALGLVASSSLGAGDAAWEAPPCPGGHAALAAAAEPARDQAVPVPLAWFTIDPELDPSGTLAGQHVRIGLGGARTRFLDLPPESSAAGPFGNLVLVVADDERRSAIRAIDGQLGCAWTLGVSADVVRRVTLDPSAGAIYEFRVDRRTRADLGVWRRSLDGSAPRRVLGPLPGNAEFGPTFTTTLGWSAEGERLTVQQCGIEQCRTRLLDPLTGAVAVLDDPGQGPLLGVAEGQAVFYGECEALPCPIEAAPVDGGRSATLVEAAGLAALVATPEGARLALETTDGGEIRRLDGSVEAELPAPAGDARLVPSIHGATAGHGLPPGWVAWSPDARTPNDAALTRLSDGHTVDVVEVTP